MEKLQKDVGAGVTAHSIEFVAVPGKTVELQSTLPTALGDAFQFIEGFSGCMVMISDQESRLVTVVTFWKGAERQRLCNENARWVKKLLTPYVDRMLRSQTQVARLAIPPSEAIHAVTGREFEGSEFKSEPCRLEDGEDCLS